jgi:hypothetical protein
MVFLKKSSIFSQNPKKILIKIIRFLYMVQVGSPKHITLLKFYENFTKKYPIPLGPCWYVQKWTPDQHLHVNKYIWEPTRLRCILETKQNPLSVFHQCVQWWTLARYEKVPGRIKTIIMVSISSKYIKFSEALLHQLKCLRSFSESSVANSGSQPPHNLWVVTLDY